MAKIAQDEGPQARTAVVKGPRAQALPTGPGLIEGAADLAQGFATMNDRINTTEAEEAVVKFERAKNDLFFNPDSGYFKTEGKAAYDTGGDATEALQNLARGYADGLSNQQSREMFNRVADRHVTRGQADIQRRHN